MVKCKHCSEKMEKIKAKTFFFGIKVTYYCKRCHTTRDLVYQLITSVKKIGVKRLSLYKNNKDKILEKVVENLYMWFMDIKAEANRGLQIGDMIIFGLISECFPELAKECERINNDPTANPVKIIKMEGKELKKLFDEQNKKKG